MNDKLLAEEEDRSNTDQTNSGSADFFPTKGITNLLCQQHQSIPSVLNEVSFKSLSIAQLSRNRYSEKVAFPSALLLRKQIYKKGKGRNDQG